MFKNLSLAATIVLFVAACVAYYWFGFGKPEERKQASVTIQGVRFNVELANTPQKRAKGLSQRTRLEEDAGMLFIFDDVGNHGFWMKDMEFSIDIVWIQEGRIAGFEKAVVPQPEKTVFNLTTYYPPEPVSVVLEVSADTVDRYGFSVGDEVAVSY